MAKRIYEGFKGDWEDKKNILWCQDVTIDNFTQEDLNGAIQLEIETLGKFCSHRNNNYFFLIQNILQKLGQKMKMVFQLKNAMR